jgi:multiple sugar transport system substrate-binding protein
MTPSGLLRGITWDHPRGYSPLEASVELYLEETGIQIQWAKRNLKDFGDASLERLAREYDLVIMDHPHSGTASVTRCMIPLDELVSNEVLSDARTNSTGPSFKSYEYNNHLWALPIDAACQVSARRKDLMLGLLIPQTWDDVFQLADHLKANGMHIGMALCPTDCCCSFLTLCAQAGDPFSEGRSPGVATAKYALTVLKKLATECHPASISWNPIGVYEHMAHESDVAYCPLAFGYTNYSRTTFTAHHLSFGPIPGKSNALLGGAGISVSAYSTSVDQAAQYAAWLCSEEFQRTVYTNAGGQPAHKKAWTHKKANAITGNFFSDTLETIEAAYVRPRSLKWPSFQERLGEIIHFFVSTDTNLEKTCKEIEQLYLQTFD